MTKKDRYIVEMRRLLEHWNAEVCPCDALPPERHDDDDASDRSSPQCANTHSAQPMAETKWRSPQDAVTQ